MHSVMSDPHVFHAMSAVNPWWDREVVPPPTFRRVAYDRCHAWLFARPAVPALLLSGPRGTGKTTILLQLVATLIERGVDRRSLVYLPLDHPVLGLLPLGKLVALYSGAFWWLGLPAILFVDEIPYATGAERALAKLADAAPGRRVLATASTRMSDPPRRGAKDGGRVAHASITTLSFHKGLA